MRCPAIRCLAVIGIILASAVSVHAADTVWILNSGFTNWVDGNCWTGGNPPGAANRARFNDPGAVNITQHPYIQAGTTVATSGLYLDNYDNLATRVWNLYGSGTLQIGSQGVYQSNDRANSRIFPVLELTAPQDWTLMRGGYNIEIRNRITGSGGINLVDDGTLYYISTNTPTFGGGLTIGVNGIVRWDCRTNNSTRVTGFGSGPITLNNGTMRYEVYTDVNGSEFTVTNAITAANLGGKLIGWHADGVAAGSTYPHITFAGPLTLAGPLRIGQDIWPPRGNNLTWSGPITVSQVTGVRASLQQGESYFVPSVDVTGNIGDGAGTARNPLILSSLADPISIRGANNTWANGTVIELCGKTEHSDTEINAYVAPLASSLMGTGDIRILPGGRLRLASSANVNAGRTLTVLANNMAQGCVELMYDAAPPSLSADSNGSLVIGDTDYDTVLDMSTMGNGRMFLGTSWQGAYDGVTLGVGADNIYRLGAGDANLPGNDPSYGLRINRSVLVGTAGVVVGNMSWNGNGYVVLDGDNNTFTGDLDIIGPRRFNNPGGSAVEAYVSPVANQSPLGNTNGTVNLYGSELRLLGVSGGQPVVKGTLRFSGQSMVRVWRTYGSWDDYLTQPGQGFATTLEFNDLQRQNRAMLVWHAYCRAFGTKEILKVKNPPLNTNGMLPPYIVTYHTEDNAETGFAYYDNTTGMLRATWTQVNNLAGAGATDITTQNAVTLAADATTYALRTTGSIGGASKITIKSGGLIAGGIINPALDFEANEGVIYASASSVLRGKISGTGGLTLGGSSIFMTNVLNDFSGLITVHNDFCPALDNATGARGLGNADNDIYMNGGYLRRYDSNAAIYGDRLLATRTVTLGPLGGFFSGNYASLDINGQVTGSGRLVGIGGTINLYGAGNNYTGGTEARCTIYGRTAGSLGTGDVLVHHNGQLYVSVNDAASSSARVTVAANGSVYFESTAPVIAALDGCGSVRLANNCNLTVGGGNADFSFYGRIYDNAAATPGRVTKTGSGTWQLYGQSELRGGVTVAQGELRLMGQVASNVVVNAGATLSGVGFVGGNLDVNGTLAVTLRSGSDYDRITVSRIADVTGAALEVTLAPGYNPPSNSAWTIVDGASLTGSFVSVPDGFAVRDAGGGNLELSNPARGTLIMLR